MAGVVFIYYLVKDFASLNGRKIIAGFVLIGILIIAFKILEDNHFTAKGFSSILNSIQGGFTDRSSQERRDLWRLAFEYAKDTAFMGGGAGSTAYTVGFYTHNIFVDILSEYGIFGTIFATFLFAKALAKGLHYSRHYKRMEFMLIVFLCGFIMLLFSGSWYSEGAIWLAGTAILAFDGVDIYEENTKFEQQI